MSTPLALAALVYLAGMVRDAHSTYLGLRTGRAREKNPVSRWIFERTERFGLVGQIVAGAVVKDVLLGFGVAYTLHRVTDGEVAPIAWLLLTGVAQLYVARKNYALAARLGRR